MNEWQIIEEAMTAPERSLTAEDTLLNALESVGLIHPDWEGIDHQDLPKDIRDAVTRAIIDLPLTAKILQPTEFKFAPSLNNTSHANSYI